MTNQLQANVVYLWMRAVAAFASTMVLTYELVYQTIAVGLSPFQLVIVGVVLESMTLFFEIPTGVVADLYSRRLSVIIGFCLTGVGFLIEGMMPTFGGVLTAQVFWGIGFTFFSGAEAAWITDEIGEQRAAQLFMRGSQVGQIMSLAGIVISSMLVTIQLQLPLLVGACIYLGLTLFLIFFMAEDGFQPAPNPTNLNILARMSGPFCAGIRVVRARVALVIVLLVGIVIGLYVGGFDRLYTPHLIDNFAFPAVGNLDPVVWFGILSGIISLFTLLGLEMVRKRLDLTKQTVIVRLLTVLYSGMILCTIIFALTQWFVVAAVCFCISQTLRNIGRPMLIVWINQNSIAQVRATVISMYWQSNGLGQIVGSPIIGWIGTVFSLRAALVTATLVYSAVLPLLRWAAYNESDEALSSMPN